MISLSEYNFKIIYQSDKQNLKVNTLTQMSNVKLVEANNDQKLYQHQILLSESKFDLQFSDIKESDQESVLNLTEKLTIQKQIIVEN